MICRDWDGVTADIAAFNKDRLALWLRRAPSIGEQLVLGPRLGEPLQVFDSVWAWLRGGRDGVLPVVGRGPPTSSRMCRFASTRSSSAKSCESGLPVRLLQIYVKDEGRGMTRLIPIDEALREAAPPPLSPGGLWTGFQRAADRHAAAGGFKLEDWNDITFDPNEEYLVDDVLPMRGFGLI